MIGPRQFDWGPGTGPAATASDAWLYVVLAIMLVIGAAVLFIDRGPGPSSPPGAETGPMTLAGGTGGMPTVPSASPGDGAPGTAGDRWVGHEPAAPAPSVGAVGSDSAGPGSGTAADEGRPEADDPPVVVRPTRYEVQLGAFGDEESARETINAVAARVGVRGELLPPATPEDLFRVVVGPFATEAEADAMAVRLNAADFPSFVVESP